MSKGKHDETIQVYARIRPPDKKKSRRHGTAEYDINTENEKQIDLLKIIVPKDGIGGYIDNTIEKHSFQFEKVFDQQSNQEHIFNTVALPVVNNVINGYNGTIFAYGQTGSGKTFTMTGGPENYDDRGLIPRTISQIYSKIQSLSTNESFSIRVSYLEIYNNNGYDLLDPSHENSKLEDLPKVRMYEDESGIMTLTDISLTQANTEEDALNLLFVGDTNRMICETPNNDTSSRSHCIFTIFLEARTKTGVDSDKIRRSKLHLVDLAGSERVSKSQVTGSVLKESTYINLSLHFLEHCIVSLHEKMQGKRSHVPYRSSMITSFLRDSLGGNCKTVMIATISLDKKCLSESISTCKFSQRVALIKNNAKINEEIDPNIVIAKLKLQVKQLKQELAILRNEQIIEQGPLSQQEKIDCTQLIERYIEPNNDDSQPQHDNTVLLPIQDPRKVQYCYQRFRTLCATHVNKLTCSTINNPKLPPNLKHDHSKVVSDKIVLQGEVSKLKQTVWFLFVTRSEIVGV